MQSDELGFWARVWLAIIVPWKILFNVVFAARVQRLVEGGAGAAATALPAGDNEPAAEAAPPPPTTTATPRIALTEVKPEELPATAAPARRDVTPALQLLAIMQREGRLIDFLQEDMASFSDAEIGAAARVVHEGCRKGLKEYLELAPVRTEAEGAAVVLERGFDPSRTRITGSPAGDPPFRGRLAHHGWLVKDIRLPTLAAGHDPSVVAPAEVEIGERAV